MNLLIPYHRVLYKLTRKKETKKGKEHMMTTLIDTTILTAMNTIKTGTYHDVYDWIVYQWWFTNDNNVNNVITNVLNMIPDYTVMRMVMNSMVNKNLIKPTGSMAYGPDGKLHTVYKLTTVGYNQLMSMTSSYDFYSEDDEPYVKNKYNNVPLSI